MAVTIVCPVNPGNTTLLSHKSVRPMTLLDGPDNSY